jgi:hypothetical protein
MQLTLARHATRAAAAAPTLPRRRVATPTSAVAPRTTADNDAQRAVHVVPNDLSDDVEQRERVPGARGTKCKHEVVRAQAVELSRTPWQARAHTNTQPWVHQPSPPDARMHARTANHPIHDCNRPLPRSRSRGSRHSAAANAGTAAATTN